MNIVIAPDSFKGSLTAIQVTDIIEKAILDVYPSYSVTKKPMADGGEGTIDSLLSSTKGKNIPIKCTGPLGDKISTSYAIIEDHTAIIEIASIAGLTQVPIHQRNPDHTTTYGLGEVIIDALDKGCNSFIIGLGGSATNDGGLGMLLALGMQAFDQNNEQVGMFGENLHSIKTINLSTLDSRLQNVEIKVASDVDNPLCGDRGASAVYGPQKGATKEQVQAFDVALHKFGSLIESTLNQSIQNTSGAGAAGGLGFGLLAIGSKLVSGAELLANAINIEQVIKKADLVITGEGQSDEQTLYGKAPGYIASMASKYNVPTILISGGLKDVEMLNSSFVSCFSTINQPFTLQECMEQADYLLYQQAQQVIQLVGAMR